MKIYILPVLLGLLPTVAFATDNPANGDLAGNDGVNVTDAGSHSYTLATGDMVINGAFRVSDPAGATAVNVSNGQFKTLNLGSGNDGSLVNTSVNGLKVSATAGMDIAGAIINAAGTMNLTPGAKESSADLTAAGIVSGPAGQILINVGTDITRPATFVFNGITTGAIDPNVMNLPSNRTYAIYTDGDLSNRLTNTTPPSNEQTDNGNIVFYSGGMGREVLVQTGADVYVGGVINNSSYRKFTIAAIDGKTADFTVMGGVNNNGGGGVISIGDETGGAFNNISFNDTIFSIGNAADQDTAINLYGNTISLMDVYNGAYSDFTAHAAGEMHVESFNNSAKTSGNVDLSADTIMIMGDISNLGTDSVFNMTTKTGDVRISGNLDNSGANMNIMTPGFLAIDGTMKNDMEGGTGTLRIGSSDSMVGGLDVEDSTTSGSDVAVVNKGAFYAYVQGSSYFNGEFDNDTGANTFVMNTGTLHVGKGSGTLDAMGRLLTSSLDTFDLLVRNGGITTSTIANTGKSMRVVADNINVNGDVRNSGDNFYMETTGSDPMLITGIVDNTAGNMTIANKTSILIDGDVNNAGTALIGSADEVAATGNLTIGGDVTNSGTMQLLASNTAGAVNIAGEITNNGTGTTGACIGADCDLFVNARDITTKNITSNSGRAMLFANGGEITTENIVANGGFLDINGNTNVSTGTITTTGDGQVQAEATAGNLTIGGNMDANGTGGIILRAMDTVDFGDNDFVVASGASGGIFAVSDNALITGNIKGGDVINNGGVIEFAALNNISLSGDMVSTSADATSAIITSDLDIDGNVDASAGGQIMLISASVIDGFYPEGSTMPIGTSYAPWLDATIGGDVSDGVAFGGLGHAQIGGNYTFGDNSTIDANVMPIANGGNVFASVDDNGVITNNYNGVDSSAIMNVDGQFITDLTDGGTLSMNIFDVIDTNTAIWLLNANGGIVENGEKLRDIPVALSYCNADGSKCFDYMQTLRDENGELVDATDMDADPGFIRVNDNTGDGTDDAVYVVFDPRFGGPAKMFKIQPKVGADPAHDGESYDTAGAIDGLTAGLLNGAGFADDSPIEALKSAADGTIWSDAINDLYNRMDDYVSSRDTTNFTGFAKLFVPTELKQAAVDMAVNEHTSRRPLADRLFDELTWNRNRNDTQVWADASFGNFSHDGSGTIDGDMWNLTAGFDIQWTANTIVGATARVSSMSSDQKQIIDMSFADTTESGTQKTNVDDLSFGIGAYFLNRINQNVRWYGNLNLNMDMIDIDRNQSLVGKISGDANAFSVMGEVGLLHNIWLQYIVGNVYARIGYNFGLDGDEKVAGDNYMKIEGDGYFILTPGYELLAQKKIYLNEWLYLKPFIGAGIEYDLGGIDAVQFRYAPAMSTTAFDTDIDPLWLSARVGIDIAGVGDWRVGAQYEYRYNDTVKINTVRISGSLRF